MKKVRDGFGSAATPVKKTGQKIGLKRTKNNKKRHFHTGKTAAAGLNKGISSRFRKDGRQPGLDGYSSVLGKEY